MSAGPLLFAEGIDNDDDRATLSEEELQAEEDSQIEAATRETSSSARSDTLAREKQLLEEMTEIAETARGLPDARVRKLVDWIRETMCPGLPPLGTMQAQSLFQKPMLWSVSVVACTETDPGTSPRSADGASTESC